MRTFQAAKYKTLLILVFQILIFGTGFTTAKTSKSIDLLVFEKNGNLSSVILSDKYYIYQSIEQVDTGKFIIHYDPDSCLYRNGFIVSNGGNEVDFSVSRLFSLGYWVCGQAILSVKDLNGEYTGDFISYVKITIYPESQIVP